MRPAVVALVAVAVLGLGYLAHRGLTAMERRGWIYYRTRSRGAMGAAAMFGLNEVFQPSAHTSALEQQADDRRGPRRQAPGDPPAKDGDLTQPDGESARDGGRTGCAAPGAQHPAARSGGPAGS